MRRKKSTSPGQKIDRSGSGSLSALLSLAFLLLLSRPPPSSRAAVGQHSRPQVDSSLLGSATWCPVTLCM